MTGTRSGVDNERRFGNAPQRLGVDGHPSHDWRGYGQAQSVLDHLNTPEGMWGGLNFGALAIKAVEKDPEVDLGRPSIRDSLSYTDGSVGLKLAFRLAPRIGGGDVLPHTEARFDLQLDMTGGKIFYIAMNLTTLESELLVASYSVRRSDSDARVLNSAVFRTDFTECTEMNKQYQRMEEFGSRFHDELTWVR